MVKRHSAVVLPSELCSFFGSSFPFCSWTRSAVVSQMCRRSRPGLASRRSRLFVFMESLNKRERRRRRRRGQHSCGFRLCQEGAERFLLSAEVTHQRAPQLIGNNKVDSKVLVISHLLEIRKEQGKKMNIGQSAGFISLLIIHTLLRFFHLKQAPGCFSQLLKHSIWMFFFFFFNFTRILTTNVQSSLFDFVADILHWKYLLTSLSNSACYIQMATDLDSKPFLCLCRCAWRPVLGVAHLATQVSSFTKWRKWKTY